MAEARRFELRLGHDPTVGFQDRSLQPLGYASRPSEIVATGEAFVNDDASSTPQIHRGKRAHQNLRYAEKSYKKYKRFSHKLRENCRTYPEDTIRSLSINTRPSRNEGFISETQRTQCSMARGQRTDQTHPEWVGFPCRYFRVSVVTSDPREKQIPTPHHRGIGRKRGARRRARKDAGKKKD